MAKVELADILRKYAASYAAKYPLSAQQSKVIGAITKCRTAALGGHRCACRECGCTKVFYNSCRDRHCPKCQSLATERWLARRREELLPVAHYHLVFTVPPALHGLLRHNERRGYGALLRQAWASLKTLCDDRRYLGARTGALMVLHTWGQNLHFHPHVHCLVPAGGLSEDEGSWVEPKHNKYLVPVRALSRLFRGKLVSRLRSLHRLGSLRLPDGRRLRAILDEAMRSDWVVYAKAPFAGPGKLLRYLGRYVKRVAISNDRIIAVNKGHVRFGYRDYADGNRKKVMELEATEFIRRFVQHILPGGLCKVRYYGLLATRNRSSRLARCHRLLGRELVRNRSIGWQELYERLSGRRADVCQHCGSTTVVVEWLPSPERSPPWSSPIPHSPKPAISHPRAA